VPFATNNKLKVLLNVVVDDTMIFFIAAGLRQISKSLIEIDPTIDPQTDFLSVWSNSSDSSHVVFLNRQALPPLQQVPFDWTYHHFAR
jgi:hypothetical protein